MTKPKITNPAPHKKPEAAVAPKLTDWDAKLSGLLPAVFALYIAALIFGVLHHESWADEAQSWLLAKDLSLPELFKTLPSEGHPPLWYLILFPFAKLGFPYETVKCLSALFMAGAVYILLFKTKVKIWLKLAMPFSYHFLYQYAIFGRSYSLIALFILLIVWLYPQRYSRPWLFALCVAGLFNTHMLGYTFTACIAGLYFVDAIQEKHLKGSVLAAGIFMAGAGLYLIPFFAGNGIVNFFETTVTDRLGNINQMLKYGLIPQPESLWVGILFLAFLAFSLLSRPKVFLLLIGGMSGIFYIYAFRYSYIQPRHYGVLIMILAGTFLLADYYKTDKLNLNIRDMAAYGTWAMVGMFALHIHPALVTYRSDAEDNYSDAKGVADYIIDNNLEKSIIVGHDAWAAMAILPYLPDDMQLYDPKCNRFFRHYIFDTCFMQKEKFEMANSVFNPIRAYPDRMDEMIFVFNYQINTDKVPFVELLYASPGLSLYQKETFNVYRIKESYREQVKTGLMAN